MYFRNLFKKSIFELEGFIFYIRISSFQIQVGPTGKAVGIDHIEELVNDSIKNVKKDPDNERLFETGQLKLLTGDGRKGYEQDAPYDAIHVGAAAATLPQAVRTKHFSHTHTHPVG